MTYSEVYRKGIQILKNAGIEAPANDAGVMLCYAANCDRIFLYASGDSLLDEGIERFYKEMLNKRVQGYPLQYLTGTQEFMSLEFETTPGVLIPRQDTELLVETVIGSCIEDQPDILDMCTGSGCIAISLAHYISGCRLTAADKMPEALAIAVRNAVRNGVCQRICFIESDLFENIPEKRFDIIVSNPPYIRTDDICGLSREVRDFEPVEALDGGYDGLFFYREIIKTSPSYLNDGGMLAFETGYNQAFEVANMMKSEERFTGIRICKDLAGIDRVVTGRLTVKEQ